MHIIIPICQRWAALASLISFRFQKKMLSVFPNSCVVAMTRFINPFDHPSIHLQRMCLLNDSSMSFLSQRATERERGWGNGGVWAPLWSTGSTICGDEQTGNNEFIKLPLALLPFVINGSDIRQAVLPYLMLVQQSAAVFSFPSAESTGEQLNQHTD